MICPEKSVIKDYGLTHKFLIKSCAVISIPRFLNISADAESHLYYKVSQCFHTTFGAIYPQPSVHFGA